jgi:ferredoxin
VALLDNVSVRASGEASPGAALPVAVTLRERGRSRVVEAYEGEALMIVLKRAGLGLMAVCGGKGACGTCRVAFAPDWAARLPPAEKRELRLLAHLKAAANERLSCRIPLSAALEGLQVYACE